MPGTVSEASDRPLAPIVVYGATGHTGRMVCAELSRRALAFALSGRDAERLRVLAASLWAGDVRPGSVDRAPSLAAAFAGASAVINCAGPFLDTADAVCRAALDAGAHYLDLTAERPAATHCFESFAAPARERGLSVLPAAAFYGGLADLLATAAIGDWTRRRRDRDRHRARQLAPDRRHEADGPAQYRQTVERGRRPARAAARSRAASRLGVRRTFRYGIDDRDAV